MKRGIKKQIKINDKMYQVEFLGQGAFTTAYKADDTVYCVVNQCLMKEALTFCDPKRHIPKITHLETMEEVSIYSMPYYEPLTANSKKAWADFKELYRVYNMVHDKYIAISMREGVKWWHNGYNINCEIIETANVSDELKAALWSICLSISNYSSSCTFEIAKRNLKVDKNGDLILLDIAFDGELLERMRHEKKRY